MDTASTMQVPMWWLIASGVFFVLVAILFIVLIVMVSALIKVIKGLEPPITSLITKVDDLVPTVKSLVVKVEALTEKVEGIADSTKTTVDIVGARARTVATGFEHLATAAMQRFQAAAPLIGTALAGFRLYNMFMQSRGKKPGTVHIEKTKKGLTVDLGAPSSNASLKEGTTEHASRGVEQSGSSSGS